jgi:hypothetical protein
MLVHPNGSPQTGGARRSRLRGMVVCPRFHERYATGIGIIWQSSSGRDPESVAA